MAFVLLHDLGHLTQRWQNILTTPEMFADKEAGSYLEISLNSGRRISLRRRQMARKEAGERVWKKYMLSMEWFVLSALQIGPR